MLRPSANGFPLPTLGLRSKQSCRLVAFFIINVDCTPAKSLKSSAKLSEEGLQVPRSEH